MIVEAMKMEHTMRSPRDGVVRRLAATPGQKADAGAILAEIEERGGGHGPPPGD